MDTSISTCLHFNDPGFRIATFDAHKTDNVVILTLAQEVINGNTRRHLITNFQDILQGSKLHDLKVCFTVPEILAINVFTICMLGDKFKQ